MSGLDDDDLMGVVVEYAVRIPRAEELHRNAVLPENRHEVPHAVNRWGRVLEPRCGVRVATPQAFDAVKSRDRPALHAIAERTELEAWSVAVELSRRREVDAAKTFAADSLRRAQEFVRSREKWKQQDSWPAWQLWGLGD